MQHVKGQVDVYNCDGSYNYDKSEQQDYSEAWRFSKKGQKLHDRWKELKYTDGFTHHSFPKTRGRAKKVGTIRFFCDKESGDLNHDPNWNSEGCGGESGSLLCYQSTPPWWDNYQKDVGQGSHEGGTINNVGPGKKWGWCCCPENDKTHWESHTYAKIAAASANPCNTNGPA